MAESIIEWTDYTFNGWIGCSKVSSGCANCYAEADFDKRKGRAKWGPNGTRSKTSEANWKLPKKWNREASRQHEQWLAEVRGTAECLGDPRPEKPHRSRVFCASLADVFEDWDDFIVDHHGKVIGKCLACGHRENQRAHCSRCGGAQTDLEMSDLRRDLFALIDATPHLDWVLLTKRPENIRRMWPASARWVQTGDRVAMLESPIGSRHFCGTVYDESHRKAFSLPGGYEVIPHGGPVCERGAGERETIEECKAEVERAFGGIAYRKNVWLLTSVENQETADERIPELLKCRDLAPVLGLSCEPLLGPVDLNGDGGWLVPWEKSDGVCGPDVWNNMFVCENGHAAVRYLKSEAEGRNVCLERGCPASVFPAKAGIDWVICGSESGPKRRPMPTRAAESLRQQCQSAGVAFFMKQMEIEGKVTGDVDKFPESLRVREFPTTKKE